MLIGIDGNEANTHLRVGVSEYAFQLIEHLYQILKLKDNNQDRLRIRIYLKEKQKVKLPLQTSWWQYEIFGPKPFWTQLALPWRLYLEKEKPSIFFTPSHYAPRKAIAKTVISMMDLSFIHFPEMFTRKDLWQLRYWTRYSVKQAEKILTISNFSKKAIVDYYRIADEKVVVIYPGYDRERFKYREQKIRYMDVCRKYKINQNYLLFLSTLQPRKNIVRLIDAFHQLINKKKISNLQLVISGRKGWLFNEIFNKIKENNLLEKVIYIDYAPLDDLPALYHGAKCLILPSLYEGFGLPVVEAMACGVPVVVSNVSSLPEVAGDAGIYVDPYSIDSISQGIYQGCFNQQLRNECIKRGLHQVKAFDWFKCARLTLEVLKNLKN